MRLSTCALSTFTHLETPLYDLKVDTQSEWPMQEVLCFGICNSNWMLYVFCLSVNEQLFKTDKFSWVPKNADEDEHSIEMHLPYVAKVMEE